MNRYEVTFLYVYEDSETVEVVADSEQEAERLEEAERDGPDYAWDHASVSSDEIYSIQEVESDITEEVEA